MNSEELEASLRTEFESYLKEIFAEMRQELGQLQEKVASEIERHKSTLDETFNEVLSRTATNKELDASFKDTVMEHLRLSRDEGARITAMAFAEAEEMEKENTAPVVVEAPPSTGIKEMYEAVSDISNKASQAEILKSLVHHAANFASRGAFFIVKNEHLVGWRVFGNETGASEEKIREVFLSVSTNSILSTAIKSLETVESPSSEFADDVELLSKFEFSEPEKMVAIPLVARGRGVAVLYADYQNDSDKVNVEALQTLTRVAGLTVEVLASAKTSSATSKKETVKSSATEASEQSENVDYQQSAENSYQPTENSYQAVSNYQSFEAPTSEPVQEISEPAQESSFESSYQTSYDSVTTPVVEETYETGKFAESELEPVKEEESVSYNFDSNDYNKVEEVSYETPAQVEEFSYETQTPVEETYSPTVENSWSQPVEDNSWKSSVETNEFSAQEYAENFAKETDPSEYAKEKDFSFQPTVELDSSETPSATDYQFETTQTDFQIEKPTDDFFSNYTPVQTEPAVEENKFGSFEIETNNSNSFETTSQPVESFTAPVETFTPAVETFAPPVEVAQPVSTPPVKSRLSERNVDLPIEVSEDERRLHNDARRFARLLVSEIKLYNEQKVKEGRDAGDIYERLREAIDRSREMYDKRVQPPVAAKFDYFHYELLNTLAEGDQAKLGADYPGAAV